MPNVHARLRRGLGLLTAVALSATVAVVAAPPADAAPDPRLVRKINSVMADSRVQRAKSSAVVLNAVTGERLYSRNGIVPRIPASNTKILTAAAALETLGPGFTFHTDVYRRNPVVRGVLDGRLYLKGFGDPSTREGDYALLARQVKKAGNHPGHRAAGGGSHLLRQRALQPRLGQGVRAGLLRRRDLGPHRGAQRRPGLGHGDPQVPPRPVRSAGRDHHRPGRRGKVHQDRQPDHHLGPRDRPRRSRPGAATAATRSRSPAGCRPGGRPAPGRSPCTGRSCTRPRSSAPSWPRWGSRSRAPRWSGRPRPATAPGWPGTARAPWPSC